LPLCTAIVRPINSGRMVERRDQVLIGRLSLVARTASTLSIRYASTNGPFLRERPISYPLTLMTALNDHAVRALVAAGAVALGGLTPRVNRHTAFASAAFATTVRVIDRVHGDTTNRRADTTPTLGTGFTDLAQIVLFVTDFTDGGAALDVHPTNFAGAQTDLGIGAFASQQLSRSTSGASHLSPLAGQHFNAADGRTDRNVTDRQSITRLDRRLGAADDRLADYHAFIGDDVATLAIGVNHQRDVRGTVRIVFQTFDLTRNAVLVALEIDNAIGLLVTTTLVTDGNPTIVVAAGVCGLGFNQSCKR